MANHYTSTHPSSRFVQTVIAQRSATDVRRMLRDRDYSEHRGDVVTRRTLADDDEVLDVLADRFDLRFPRGTRFHCGRAERRAESGIVGIRGPRAASIADLW